MKREFPLPLNINCDGLSQKRITELADRLSLHFADVKIFGDDIVATRPLSLNHYEAAWQIIDRYGVKAA